MEKQEEKKGFRKIEKRILEHFNFYRFNYLKYWIVAAIDVVIATSSTVIVYLIYVSKDGPFSRQHLLIILALAALVSTLSFYLFKTYRNIIRYMSMKGLLPLGYAVLLKSVCLTVALYFLDLGVPHAILYKFLLLDILFTYVTLIVIRLAMIMVYEIVNEKVIRDTKRVLIYGSDEKAVALLVRLHKVRITVR